jgi:catechol 2,3-dioxygenase-like lactoylglutathione lyase family enzyme
MIVIFIALPAVIILTMGILMALDEDTDGQAGSDAKHGRFTGKILPVFYVKDVLASKKFYQSLGFEFHHFFDYTAGEQVSEWTSEEPPIWAEMAAGHQTFGLHRMLDGKKLIVGGMRHYFLVEDVDAHYKFVKNAGIETGTLIDKKWMKMFSVRDPDGHEIFFGTEK